MGTFNFQAVLRATINKFSLNSSNIKQTKLQSFPGHDEFGFGQFDLRWTNFCIPSHWGCLMNPLSFSRIFSTCPSVILCLSFDFWWNTFKILTLMMWCKICCLILVKKLATSTEIFGICLLWACAVVISALSSVRLVLKLRYQFLSNPSSTGIESQFEYIEERWSHPEKKKYCQTYDILKGSEFVSGHVLGSEVTKPNQVIQNEFIRSRRNFWKLYELRPQKLQTKMVKYELKCFDFQTCCVKYLLRKVLTNAGKNGCPNCSFS